MTRASVSVVVRKYSGEFHAVSDLVAGEEPLEIRLEEPGLLTPLTVTMRTPGDDFALVAGWLLAEGLVSERQEIQTLRYCQHSSGEGGDWENVVLVRLRNGPHDLSRFTRHSSPTSACGVCGIASKEALSTAWEPLLDETAFSLDTIVAMGESLLNHQRLFAKTGGVHAASLHTATGEVVAHAEDIGRHNATDKAIGHALLEDSLSTAKGLLVSGRAGYEILQKAARARIPLVASVSAPSHLALTVAERAGVCVVGFLRGESFNIYTHPERVLNTLSCPQSVAKKVGGAGI